MSHRTTWILEDSFYSIGAKYIAGIDEAGRGSLAGGLTVGIVIFENKNIYAKDSKKLTKKQRKILEKDIKNNSFYFVKEVDQEIIEKFGVSKATEFGAKEALKEVSKIQKPDIIIVDYFKIESEIPFIHPAKADILSPTVAAASILAKNYRDQKMSQMHEIYPNYGFDQHFGYGTKMHLEAIEKHGICPIHRKTFKPIKFLLNKTLF